jgi:hypothetical protein
VAITALGLGLEYDETLLGQIAQASGGSFRRLEDGDEIAEAFVDEVFSVQRLVASNIVLSLQPGPGVEIRRVLGQAVQPAGGTRSIVLGELSENQQQDVFVELGVSGHRAGANIELLDAASDDFYSPRSIGCDIAVLHLALHDDQPVLADQGCVLGESARKDCNNSLAGHVLDRERRHKLVLGLGSNLPNGCHHSSEGNDRSVAELVDPEHRSADAAHRIGLGLEPALAPQLLDVRQWALRGRGSPAAAGLASGGTPSRRRPVDARVDVRQPPG